MKPVLRMLGVLTVAGLTHLARAGTTIDEAHPYGYGANIGWINARGDGANGASIGQATCRGYLWSANTGWIGLGAPSGPTNGWRYGNAAASDWGVNHDGLGNLEGHAYGANIGWITFEQEYGRPRVNLLTGDLSGYVWGANVGWISLSNSQARVRTTHLDPGPDSDGDGLPDWWQYREAGDLDTFSADGDYDGDGSSDLEEYLADTDPRDPDCRLRLVAIERQAGNTSDLTWNVRPTRRYRLESTATVGDPDAWADVGLGELTPSEVQTIMSCQVVDSNASKHYRIRAIMPLRP